MHMHAMSRPSYGAHAAVVCGGPGRLRISRWGRGLPWPLSPCSGPRGGRIRFTPSARPPHDRVGGSAEAIAVALALHAGCPQPLALTPPCWPGAGVMSYTMLSGRTGSPLTPGGT
jgi:hypothetical protein